MRALEPRRCRALHPAMATGKALCSGLPLLGLPPMNIPIARVDGRSAVRQPANDNLYFGPAEYYNIPRTKGAALEGQGESPP